MCKKIKFLKQFGKRKLNTSTENIAYLRHPTIKKKSMSWQIIVTKLTKMPHAFICRECVFRGTNALCCCRACCWKKVHEMRLESHKSKEHT